ncbi:redoxin domain-containing protein [Patescibacteria group bacterium]
MLISHKPLEFDADLPHILGNAFYNLEEVPDLKSYDKIVLEFWRLGCRKCHQSLEEFQRLSERSTEKILFLTVHYPEMPFEKSPQLLEDFIKENNIHVPILVDQDGCTARNFGVNIHPTRIVLERDKGYKLASWGSKLYGEIAGLIES